MKSGWLTTPCSSARSHSSSCLSLARLWQLQGKQAEAQQLLAEIYGSFSEGFDTPDLKDAKKLLDELTKVQKGD